MLYEKLLNSKVHCFLCSHDCKIAPGKFGICGVRKNKDGTLYTHVYGEPIASHVDPIEKKPLYHFLPGTSSFSIATVGCNFKCSFCQNWQISQVSKRGDEVSGYELMPEEVIREAKKNNCKSVSYTYTEPTIFFEYAYESARLARKAGLYNIFVTNGYMTEKALERIRPYLDACNVDLKSFSDDFYKKICGARLKPVLNAIKIMKKLGIWIEVTTLLVPGQNDSDKELKTIAAFIASVGIEIPWHVSRFHPDYKYLRGRGVSRPLILRSEATKDLMGSLRKAKKIGEDAGLRYIYLGNVVEGNNTYCYSCNNLLVKRAVFDIAEYNIKNKKCPKCDTDIEGVFNEG